MVHSKNNEIYLSETSHQLETPKQVREIRAFQNGGTAHGQGSHSEK